MNDDKMPKRLWAWPFSGWRCAGGHWGAGKASMPQATEYVRADLYTDAIARAEAAEAERDGLRANLKQEADT